MTIETEQFTYDLDEAVAVSEEAIRAKEAGYVLICESETFPVRYKSHMIDGIEQKYVDMANYRVQLLQDTKPDAEFDTYIVRDIDGVGIIHSVWSDGRLEEVRAEYDRRVATGHLPGPLPKTEDFDY